VVDVNQNAVIKFPQILGAALSANIFVVTAQAIASLPNFHWWQLSFTSLIFLWNLKDGIDDFKSYESQKMEGFSLAPTVTFRVISYMFLVVAASNLENIRSTSLAMAGYFFTFVLWAFNSIIRRLRLNSSSEENKERLRRRMGWIVLHCVCTIACICMISENQIVIITAMFFIFIIFIVDSIDCATFKNEINENL
jgi:hypothetical protein